MPSNRTQRKERQREVCACPTRNARYNWFHYNVWIKCPMTIARVIHVLNKLHPLWKYFNALFYPLSFLTEVPFMPEVPVMPDDNRLGSLPVALITSGVWIILFAILLLVKGMEIPRLSVIVSFRATVWKMKIVIQKQIKRIILAVSLCMTDIKLCVK